MGLLDSCFPDQNLVYAQEIELSTPLTRVAAAQTEPVGDVTEQNQKMRKEWHGRLKDFRNENIWNPRLLCVICVHLLHNPVRLECGHIFCKHCLTELGRVRKDCVACGKPIGEDKMTAAPKELEEALAKARAPGEAASFQAMMEHQCNPNMDPADLERTEHFVDVGMGVFGEVSKGKFHEETVALKRLLIELEEPRVKDFQKAVTSYSTLRHDNLLLLKGAFTQGDTLALVHEFCTPGSLFSLLHRSQFRMDLRILLHVARDIASALNYLHCLGIAHFSLKSENILIDRRFKVKVADYGFRQVKDAVRIATNSIGTVQYLGPEVHQSKPGYNYAQADVFSYGILLWEMYTGHIPFGDLTDNECITKLVFNRNRPEIPASCPKELAELMADCWQEDPKARPSFYTISTRRLPKIQESVNDLAAVYEQPQVAQRAESHEPPVLIRTEEDAKAQTFSPHQPLRYIVELQIDEGFRERGVLEMSTRGISFYSKELRQLKEVFNHAWVHVRAFKSKGNVFQYYWQPFPDFQKKYLFHADEGTTNLINTRAAEVMRELSKALVEFRKQEKAKSKDAFVAARLEQQKKEESEARSRATPGPSDKPATPAPADAAAGAS
eukprot:TRINITY_DN1156_c0_g1_i1.p1 TRINITY_DN1156_c0_g1~~TRINITY_DN1156_c0_g1_i1.p1  ORF type:complete len:611 (-),score=156.21 TRINITY_DN1156_c0_g1_i1:215-2047(-)